MLLDAHLWGGRRRGTSWLQYPGLGRSSQEGSDRASLLLTDLSSSPTTRRPLLLPWAGFSSGTPLKVCSGPGERPSGAARLPRGPAARDLGGEPVPGFGWKDWSTEKQVMENSPPLNLGFVSVFPLCPEQSGIHVSWVRTVVSLLLTDIGPRATGL